MLSSSRDVVMANLPRIRTLSPYAAYACRHRGVCCTSGWDIPVEAAVHGRLRDAMARGVLASKAQASFVILPPDSPAVAMVSPIDGTCPFYDAPDHRCSVHRALGETALPTSCRHFPRICRLDDEHVDVSFSHVCPTAGEALLDARTPFDATVSPASCPPTLPYEGLDARGDWPPLLRPGVLMTHACHSNVEMALTRVLSTTTASPESALAGIAASVEGLRRWTPDAGPLDRWIAVWARELPTRVAETATCFTREESHEHDLACFGLVEASIPAAWRSHLPQLECLRAASTRMTGPSSACGDAARRYLAVRAFGGWSAYQGHGVRSVVAWLDVCLALFRLGWAETGARRPDATERELGLGALAFADLALVHLAVPEVLNRALARAERDTDD